MRRRRSRIAVLAAVAAFAAGSTAVAAAAADGESAEEGPCATTTTAVVGRDGSVVATFHDGDTSWGVRIHRDGRMRQMTVCAEFTSVTHLDH
ncbi:hypothetical protein [Streptomyces caatingaensis]|uniref:Uncharacterized protein n=1 Tax=Streptomyces caatingaensis TaxID=1678637 RepID=A0A0K9XER2_9ACTN|nr:hypothetical protein [Streptomyces caatingaensis]KNB51581.1 hypothetical protein AC230_14535 [Streptomyces caatingaensis]